MKKIRLDSKVDLAGNMIRTKWLAYQFGFSAVDTVFWSSFRKKTNKQKACRTGSNWYGCIHIAAELSRLKVASSSLSELELASSLMATGESNCTPLGDVVRICAQALRHHGVGSESPSIRQKTLFYVCNYRENNNFTCIIVLNELSRKSYQKFTQNFGRFL